MLTVTWEITWLVDTLKEADELQSKGVKAYAVSYLPWYIEQQKKWDWN